MELLVASVIGLLTSSGLYLVLRLRTFPVIMGISLLGAFYLIKVFKKKKKNNVCRAKDCSCEDCVNRQPNT